MAFQSYIERIYSEKIGYKMYNISNRQRKVKAYREDLRPAVDEYRLIVFVIVTVQKDNKSKIHTFFTFHLHY